MLLRFHNWPDNEIQAEFFRLSKRAAEIRAHREGLRRHRANPLPAYLGAVALVTMADLIGVFLAAVGLLGLFEQIRVSARQYVEQQQLDREQAEVEAEITLLEIEARRRKLPIP